MIQQIKFIKHLDNEILKKNIIPMIFCLGVWIVVILYLLRHTNMGAAVMEILLLVTIQLISSINDLYSKTIPLKLMIIGLTAGLLINIILYKTNLFSNFIMGGIVAFLLMKLLIIISKRQVGDGDWALMTVTGFFIGINGFVTILFISIVLTGMSSLFLIFTRKVTKKTEIPFAPFVFLATVFCVLSGIL
jgi:leader peptidase (prepilin peptidase) / N-methyltransferase